MDSVRVEKLRKHRGDYGIDGGLTAILGLVAMGTLESFWQAALLSTPSPGALC